jgi:phage-related protein
MYHIWYIKAMVKPDVPDFILTVRFYRTENGTEPVRDWLRSLSQEQRKTIGEDIKTVQYGWPVGMSLVRKLDSRLWEVRSHVSGGIARVIFTVCGNIMVLLHGFIKKSLKAPLDDLETARKRKNKL